MIKLNLQNKYNPNKEKQVYDRYYYLYRETELYEDIKGLATISSNTIYFNNNFIILSK